MDELSPRRNDGIAGEPSDDDVVAVDGSSPRPHSPAAAESDDASFPPAAGASTATAPDRPRPTSAERASAPDRREGVGRLTILEANPKEPPAVSDASATTTTAPAATAPTTVTPEPPLWRFVNETKKSLGYSSLHSGSYVRGKTSGELGAAYVTPDVSLYKGFPRREAPVRPEKTVYEFPLGGKEEAEREEVEVGRLEASVPPPRAFEMQNHDVGKLIIREARTEEKALPKGTFGGLPRRDSTSEDRPRVPFKEWGGNVELGERKEHEAGERRWGEVEDNRKIPADEDVKSDTRERGVRKIRPWDPDESEENFVGDIARSNRGDNRNMPGEDDVRIATRGGMAGRIQPRDPDEFEEIFIGETSWSNLDPEGVGEAKDNRYVPLAKDIQNHVGGGGVGMIERCDPDEFEEIFTGETSWGNLDPVGVGEAKDNRYVPLGKDVQNHVRGGGVGRIERRDPDELKEIFIGEIPRSNVDPEGIHGCNRDPEGIHSGDSSDDEAGYGDPMEGALLFAHDGPWSSSSSSDNRSKDVDGSTQTDPPPVAPTNNDRRKRRCLYLLLLLLLLLVVILGVLLGQANADNKAAVAASSVGAVLTPPVVVANETNTTMPSASLAPSSQPSLSPSGECPARTKAFSIELFLSQGDEYQTTATMGGGVTWKIRDACSGEVVARCLPCSTTGNVLALHSPSHKGYALAEMRKRTRISNANGRSLHRSDEEEEATWKITECLPVDGEYAYEVLPAEDAAETCCGFDPAASSITYDDVAIGDPSSRTGEPATLYFGGRGKGCASPSVAGSARPSSPPSGDPSDLPSTAPSPTPTLAPSTSTPTQSPVLFLGGCPESYSPSVVAYSAGMRVESDGTVYECITPYCWNYGFEPGGEGAARSSSLWRHGWEVVGSCEGTMAPTSHPTTAPTSSPTKSPSGSPTSEPTSAPTTTPSLAPTPAPSDSPSHSPTHGPTPSPTTRRRTRTPSKYPTARPTCSTEQDFNLCLALDMSGSVCNGGGGSECEECRASFLPIFFNSECRDKFVNEDTCCNNFANMKQFSSLMVDLLGDFPAEKSFSVVHFSTDARLANGLSSVAKTLRIIDRLDYTGGLTNHMAAIQMCQRNMPARKKRKNFIMLITDGVSSEPGIDPEGAAERAARAAKLDGTFIIPIFISTDNDRSALAFMRRLSSDGKVFDVTDFASLDKLQDSLVNQVSCS